MYRTKAGKWYTLPGLHITWWQASLTFLLLALGMLLASQWKAGPTSPIYGSTTSNSRDISVATILRLEDQQKALKTRVADMQKQLEDYQKLAASRQQTLSGLSQEMERQRMLAGTVPLVGPGVKVTLDDSTKNPLANDDANNYLIHDYELRDVVNLLWLAGAEAVSVNGERMVATSSLYCVGSTILANSTRLSPPYEITAIGDPAALEEILGRPNNLAKLKAGVTQYGLQFKVERAREVVVPAYSGPLDVKLAEVSGKK